MRVLFQALALAALFISVACSTTTSAPKGPLPTSLATPDVTAIAASEDIRIAPSDLLDISVFGVDELSGEYQVDFEGLLKMPLLGEFQAQGMTANELSNYLEDELGQDYLTNPSITVAITNTNQQVITIDGAVQKPGQYNIPGQLTLLQAVSLSGGPTSSANAKRVVVFRTVGGQRMVAGFDLQAIRAGASDDPKVYGNDVIVVDGSEIKSAYQDFLKTVPLLSLFLLF